MKHQYFNAVAVHPEQVSLEQPSVVGIWFKKEISIRQANLVLGLNELVNGSIILTLNKSGASAVKWIVALKDKHESRVAAATLARVVSRITGVTPICRQLRDNRHVYRALAA